jgi:SAM-dependent methyltransferase
MGTAETQGELWGAKASDWADANEPAWRPVFEAVLAAAGVGQRTRLLDVGCGAGGALVAARDRGAVVCGLDASKNLAEIARRRLPGASIEVGEMEALPFADEALDVVTGINSFQFAGDIVAALREARRVCRRGGTVAMLVWGRREDCDLLAKVLPPVFALLPPSPTPAAATPPLAEPGVVERLMRDAGLAPAEARDIVEPLVFPNLDTAVRAITSAMARAIRHAGEAKVRAAIVDGLTRTAPVTGGSVSLRSTFRLVCAAKELQCL